MLIVESHRALLSHGMNLEHGVVEGQAEHLNAEVDGVAGEVALRPAPIAVLDDEARISGQSKIACFVRDKLESALLEQRREGRQPGGADLLARGILILPFRRWGGRLPPCPV